MNSGGGACNHPVEEVLHGNVELTTGSGTVVLTGTYKHGVRDGEWTYYSGGGRVLTREVWRNGVLVSSEGEPVLSYTEFGFTSAARTIRCEIAGKDILVTIVTNPHKRGDRSARAVTLRDHVARLMFASDRSLEAIVLEALGDAEPISSIADVRKRLITNALNESFGGVVANVYLQEEAKNDNSDSPGQKR